MASKLEIWARAERGFLQEEEKYLKAGGKLLSPSGDDITAAKLEQLALRIEHVNVILHQIEQAEQD